jgi:hypothetical protein
MPDSIIKRVESLADKEKQGDEIMFTGRNNNPIENDDSGDDEDDGATVGVYEEGNEDEENENKNENEIDNEDSNLPPQDNKAVTSDKITGVPDENDTG